MPLFFFCLLPSPTDKQRDQVFLPCRSWGGGIRVRTRGGTLFVPMIGASWPGVWAGEDHGRYLPRIWESRAPACTRLAGMGQGQQKALIRMKQNECFPKRGNPWEDSAKLQSYLVNRWNYLFFFFNPLERRWWDARLSQSVDVCGSVSDAGDDGPRGSFRLSLKPRMSQGPNHPSAHSIQK